jgi:DNA end-binding protein Ku
MSRSLWKGSISFGLVNIPVLLYSAENRNSFDLTLLDRRDMKPVGFKRYNKKTGKEVAWEQIVKGYEYEKNRYVVLTDEDFRRANVEATQTIDILSFVRGEDISPTSFETP